MKLMAGGIDGGSGGALGFLKGESTSSIDIPCGGVTGIFSSASVVRILGVSNPDNLYRSREELSDGLFEWSTTKTDLF
jgi:hypothetical protein